MSVLPEDSSHSFTSSVSLQIAELTHLKNCVRVFSVCKVSFSLSYVYLLHKYTIAFKDSFRLMWSCLFVCGSCSERSPSGGHTWLWLACCDSSSPHHTRSHYPQPPALQLSSVTVAATAILRPCQDFNHSAVCCALTHFFLILYCTAPLFFLQWKRYYVSARWLNVYVSLLYIISYLLYQ